MSKDQLQPYDWIEKVPAAFSDADHIPLLGSPPEFPWEAFAKQFTETLEIESCSLEASPYSWKEPQDLLSGLGTPLTTLAVSLLPLQGTLFVAMPQEHLAFLMSHLLAKGERLESFLEEEYLQGFTHFLALHAIHTVEAIGFDKDLNFQLITDSRLPEEQMLTLDITAHLCGRKMAGRVLLSQELCRSAAKHYARSAEKNIFHLPLAEKVEVTLHLEAGSTTLTQREWSEVKPGDFLILEKCSLQPGVDQGKVLATLEGHPFFTAELANGNVKILEHPHYREA